ncbi:hypothetical protein ACSDQ9_11515 [Aestuariimicrobium soli]|uniref:hypothetical protein n=1 Tax=Aestuariimicrobium soli TaxID=2035834 RepID=UPI003EB976A5
MTLDPVGLVWRTWVALVGPTPERALDLVVGESTLRYWVVLLGVPLVAAFAGLLGDLGLLVINNIRGFGVAFAGLLTATQMVLTHATQAGLVWLVLLVTPGPTPPITTVLAVVLLSLAPLWFEWVGITPFLGPLFERLLHVWQFLVMWGLTAAVIDHRWWSLVVVTVAWVARMVVWSLLRAPLSALRGAVWGRLTGARRLLTASDMMNQLAAPTAAGELVHTHGPAARP